MTAKQPPIPPENRSPHGGKLEIHGADVESGASAPVNPDKVGHQGNSKVNTTHQGYQQDR
ncbi:hypothetical protein BJF93_04100 [Xaviernesmea oryzae]|uniref:Uncharacterized protein n=1 Tax=Xaviernesmea oryzae TaxID=464029 RepID=A0A1Q9AUH9_9HYPH|nr:hypothetical protein [Xaviernesmea oryzae]OLP59109.1 hypothetical protein BJF93_04100 [Xaviernesmea oryzae]SEK86280.1 hypothetical protein SAMN04487976_104222 [Xaviernesmea oryzae]